MRISVLVSGGGTNLQAILDGVADGTIPDTEVACVISNNPGAFALDRAKNSGVPAHCISPRDFHDRAAFHAALLKAIEEAGTDLVVLAGFLVVIPEEMVLKYKNRILNIHPSLIPSFCGTGFYGLRVHEEALRRGVRITGATVHFVDAGTDTGPILLQKAVEVRDDDTPQTLQRRVMEEAEWKLLPEAISLMAQNRVVVEDGRARILPETGDTALF